VRGDTFCACASDRVYELLAGDALFEELSDTCLGCCCAFAFVVVNSEANYCACEISPGDFCDGIKAIAVAHFEINENYVGVEALGHFDGFAFVGGFTDYRYMGVHFEDSLEAGAEVGMIAGYQDSNGAKGNTGVGSTTGRQGRPPGGGRTYGINW